MLDGGCDPNYLARRLTRMAVEDIGLADPRALAMSIEAWDTYDRLGSPEGDLALAQLVIYLASTAKSNAGYARSEEHTSELQSLMRISYAVFCLKNKKKKNYKLQSEMILRINHITLVNTAIRQ